MKYVDEYRDPQRIKECLSRIERLVTHPWNVMEICGGQTHSIVKYGIDQLLPNEISLIHGPGCPVCVTPVSMIDKAIDIALHQNVILASFGDMARVPGSDCSLLTAKARGADLRLVYSPLDAVEIARNNPGREVVFFAVGFETTAPTTAMALKIAKTQGLRNFSMLVSHVLVPPAMEAILSSPGNCIQGFLAAGHVCTVTGYEMYTDIAERYAIPIVVTGFEPLDILQGLELCLMQLEAGTARVENQYTRVVRQAGNESARCLLEEVFRPVSRHWRGVGTLHDSGYALTMGYRQFDAEIRYGCAANYDDPENGCISGQVLQGISKPMDCPHFGNKCVPERPLGAPMVSSEGACAAYYNHRRIERFPLIPDSQSDVVTS